MFWLFNLYSLFNDAEIDPTKASNNPQLENLTDPYHCL